MFIARFVVGVALGSAIAGAVFTILHLRNRSGSYAVCRFADASGRPGGALLKVPPLGADEHTDKYGIMGCQQAPARDVQVRSRKTLEQLVDRYPGSSSAATAKARLARMQGGK